MHQCHSKVTRCTGGVTNNTNTITLHQFLPGEKLEHLVKEIIATRENETDYKTQNKLTTGRVKAGSEV